MRRQALAALPEPAWLYNVFQPVFLACAIVVWLPFVPRVLAVVPVMLVPFALADQVAYLLRVVFPRPDESAEGAAPDVGVGTAAERDRKSLTDDAHSRV
jgi:hypothetical protein